MNGHNLMSMVNAPDYVIQIFEYPGVLHTERGNTLCVMSPKGKRARIGLRNLGSYAVKKEDRPVVEEMENEKVSFNYCTVDTRLLTIDMKQASAMDIEDDSEPMITMRDSSGQAAAHMEETLAEITQPTWTPADSDTATAAGQPLSPDDSRSDGAAAAGVKRGRFDPPPSLTTTISAHQDISELLRPRRKQKTGYLAFLGGDKLQRRMEQMKMLLHFYNGPDEHGRHIGWAAASLKTAQAWEQGTHRARKLREWTRGFLEDRHCLPFTPEATWKTSLLVNPELKAALGQHLQSVGKYVRAMDIVEYMARPEVLATYGLSTPISLSTAQTWMHVLEYRWTKVPSGQYVDGHERDDVVHYRDDVFLPAMERLDPYTRDFIDGAMVEGPVLPDGAWRRCAAATDPEIHTCSVDGVQLDGFQSILPDEAFEHSGRDFTVILSDGSKHNATEVGLTMPDGSVRRGLQVRYKLGSEPFPVLVGAGVRVTATKPTRLRRVIFWYHDESTFYANDRRQTRWVHKSEKATPRAKGEGASLMVADFVSADYGFLRSPDGEESAQILFRAGKNRDGYFTNQEILDHATLAMDILSRHYPDDDHVLIFDNAPTHLKRPDDALSARRMSSKPTAPDKPLFGVDIDVIGEDGRPVYTPNGKKQRQRVRMGDARFPDGRPQSLYFDEKSQRPGVFKGMAQILEERGIRVSGKRAQCPDFKCKPPALDCCVRRVLYNQPDFCDAESVLENHCRECAFQVLFLPKFHCEINPIEQCWGAAKREYRKCPPSTLEADLEKNMRKSLDAIPVESIRR